MAASLLGGSSYDPIETLLGISSGTSSAGLLGSGSGSTGGIPPVTTTQKATKDDTTSQRQVSDSVTTTDKTGTVTTDMQNTTDEALAALNAIITGQSIDPLVQQKDIAAGENITSLQDTLTTLDPAEAEARAAGRVAELSRTLLEQTLPDIFGGAEMSGTGGNALAQLLVQSEAIKTGEAQSRAVEEAINTIIAQQIEGAEVMGGLTSGTSGMSTMLMDALELSRGAVEQGTVTSQESGTARTTGTTTSTGKSTGKSTGTQETIDPLQWAEMLNQAALTSAQQDPADKELAAFLAAGGDPGALSNTSPWDYGQTDYNQQLLKSIQGLI